MLAHDECRRRRAVKVTLRCDPALLGLLPPPVPADGILPDWLRAMAPRVHSPLHGRDIRTVKQCPPFIDAMRRGFMVLLPCDLQVRQGRFSWDWPLPPLTVENHPRAPLSFHPGVQLQGIPGHDGRSAAIKFNSFWTIETEPGWSIFAMHPVNRMDLPFQTLSGLVDSDRFNDAGINFPALWRDPDFEGTLARGTPVAQCLVLPREPLELSIETLSGEGAQRYTSLVGEVLAQAGVYRRRFRVKPESGPRGD
jgi:hypothetical protein